MTIYPIDHIIRVYSQIEQSIMKKPCKKPCPSCPYLDTSIPGYFGDNDGSTYAKLLHADQINPCHSRNPANADGMLVTIIPCTGHLLAQRKACKKNDNPEAIQLNQELDESGIADEFSDKALGLNFYQHHGIQL